MNIISGTRLFIGRNSFQHHSKQANRVDNVNIINTRTCHIFCRTKLEKELQLLKLAAALFSFDEKIDKYAGMWTKTPLQSFFMILISHIMALFAVFWYPATLSLTSAHHLGFNRLGFDLSIWMLNDSCFCDKCHFSCHSHKWNNVKFIAEISYRFHTVHYNLFIETA